MASHYPCNSQFLHLSSATERIRKQIHFGNSFSLTQVMSIIHFKMHLLKLLYLHSFGGDKLGKEQRGISKLILPLKKV